MTAGSVRSIARAVTSPRDGPWVDQTENAAGDHVARAGDGPDRTDGMSRATKPAAIRRHLPARPITRRPPPATLPRPAWSQPGRGARGGCPQVPVRPRSGFG